MNKRTYGYIYIDGLRRPKVQLLGFSDDYCRNIEMNKLSQVKMYYSLFHAITTLRYITRIGSYCLDTRFSVPKYLVLELQWHEFATLLQLGYWQNDAICICKCYLQTEYLQLCFSGTEYLKLAKIQMGICVTHGQNM